MYAGLQHAAGDYVAVMDADLQDPPKLIPQMYEELEQGEYNRFSKGIFGWVGFRTKWLEYHNVERAAGESKWSVGRLLKYSLDGILGFSTLPLSLSSYGGIFLCAASFLTVCFLVIRYLIFHDRVQGWTTLMCAIFFYRRRTASVRGNPGPVPGAYLYGGKKAPGLYIERKFGGGTAGGSRE